MTCFGDNTYMLLQVVTAFVADDGSLPNGYAARTLLADASYMHCTLFEMHNSDWMFLRRCSVNLTASSSSYPKVARANTSIHFQRLRLHEGFF